MKNRIFDGFPLYSLSNLLKEYRGKYGFQKCRRLVLRAQMELDKNFGHSEKLHPSTFDSATFYSRPTTHKKNVQLLVYLPPLQPEAQITVFIYIYISWSDLRCFFIPLGFLHFLKKMRKKVVNFFFRIGWEGLGDRQVFQTISRHHQMVSKRF